MNVLYNDFKDIPWFRDIGTRISIQYGNSNWQDLIGPEVSRKRLEVKDAVKEVEEELKQRRKDAQEKGIAPVKKRRRLA